MNKIKYKVKESWTTLYLQPDVQEGGGRPVQKQTQQWAHDVSHEGQFKMFNILHQKPQMIYIQFVNQRSVGMDWFIS